MSEPYAKKKPLLDAFASALHDELSAAMENAEIALGFPIQARVKSEQSIGEKLQRKSLSIEDVETLPDLVGLRIIVLYQRDVQRVIDALSQFKILPPDDASQRLSEDRFGYASIHVDVRIPENWLDAPRLKKFGGLRAEVQVRTLAQHLWASVSHDLQYKREKSVPKQVRRAISRVSALLETVDLEFERVLANREEYVDELQRTPFDLDMPLDIESLRLVLAKLWPNHNREMNFVSDLLDELKALKINTSRELTAVINEERVYAEEADARRLAEVSEDYAGDEDDRNWVASHSTYYSAVGMTTRALAHKYGERYQKLLRRRLRESSGE